MVFLKESFKKLKDNKKNMQNYPVGEELPLYGLLDFYINKGSYMSAHVLLILLNELRKSGKM